MSTFYKFLIPLFALALLVGCNKTAPGASSQDTAPTYRYGFTGELMKGPQTAVLRTSMGDITVTLDADKAPKAATNFIYLSKAGVYNGLSFHRIVPGFVIQGGDPNGDGTGGTSIFGTTFADEITDIPMERGKIAMANRGPNTNESQFFIIQGPGTPWLAGRFTVFGEVTDGMDIVDKIANAPHDDDDRPKKPITFTIEAK